MRRMSSSLRARLDDVSCWGMTKRLGAGPQPQPPCGVWPSGVGAGLCAGAAAGATAGVGACGCGCDAIWAARRSAGASCWSVPVPWMCRSSRLITGVSTTVASTQALRRPSRADLRNKTRNVVGRELFQVRQRDVFCGKGLDVGLPAQRCNRSLLRRRRTARSAQFGAPSYPAAQTAEQAAGPRQPERRARSTPWGPAGSARSSPAPAAPQSCRTSARETAPCGLEPGTYVAGAVAAAACVGRAAAGGATRRTSRPSAGGPAMPGREGSSRCAVGGGRRLTGVMDSCAWRPFAGASQSGQRRVEGGRSGREQQALSSAKGQLVCQRTSATSTTSVLSSLTCGPHRWPPVELTARWGGTTMNRRVRGRMPISPCGARARAGARVERAARNRPNPPETHLAHSAHQRRGAHFDSLGRAAARVAAPTARGDPFHSRAEQAGGRFAPYPSRAMPTEAMRGPTPRLVARLCGAARSDPVWRPSAPSRLLTRPCRRLGFAR
jgi:hypothetical protein